MLQSGQTLRGTYSIEYTAAGAGNRGSSPISFPLTLASAPAVNFIAVGGTPPAACPGTSANPQATAGNLCVYESSQMNVGFRCLARAGASYICNMGEPWGTTVFVAASAAGQTTAIGTWAVTAP